MRDFAAAGFGIFAKVAILQQAIYYLCFEGSVILKEDHELIPGPTCTSKGVSFVARDL
jgi:hypothetical protein